LNECWIRERKWCGVLGIEKVDVEWCWKKKTIGDGLMHLFIVVNAPNSLRTALTFDFYRKKLEFEKIEGSGFQTVYIKENL